MPLRILTPMGRPAPDSVKRLVDARSMMPAQDAGNTKTRALRASLQVAVTGTTADGLRLTAYGRATIATLDRMPGSTVDCAQENA